ncbi:MAG TPA: tripartite tricarboxylate transporter substrate binding protein [Chloroflexota bacterium]
MLTRKLALALVALASLALLSAAGCGTLAKGDDYPNKQITYMVTFAPGGQSDREARRQQPYLEKALGQKIVIDYKDAGGGAVGWAEASRGKPDGYQITGINLPHIIIQPLQQDVGYKTEQLLPVAMFQSTPLGLIALNNSPYKSVADLVDAAKKNPGKITIGGSGTGSGPQFAVVQLEKLAGVKFEYVPFNGAAPSITAFLGGHINALMANSDDVVKYSDQSKVIGIATEARFPALPNALTFKEQGINLVETVDRGVAVPAGTPDKVVTKLEKAFLDITKTQEVIDAQKKEGFVTLSMGAKDSKAYVDKLIPRYKDLMASTK